MMRRLLKIVAWVLGIVIVLALGATGVARYMAGRKYNKAWTTHEVSFPIPFPLSEAELVNLRTARLQAGASGADPLAGVDIQAEAMGAAIKRGDRLLKTRVTCAFCHGDDFGGKVIIDDALVGYWAPPNITTGEGSVTTGFKPSDWDRAVRHGVRHNGQSSSMPSNEFLNLSDHELSDVVAYIRSRPPVNRTMKPVGIGPIFSFVVGFGGDSLPAFAIDHQKAHAVEPPVESASVELGEHIVQVCRGCHGDNLSGGKIAADPNMPIVANLTPHETGLKGWTEGDFLHAMREGKRKDGTAILPQMPWQTFGQMNDTELRAVWAYLQTVPAAAKGIR